MSHDNLLNEFYSQPYIYKKRLEPSKHTTKKPNRTLRKKKSNRIIKSAKLKPSHNYRALKSNYKRHKHIPHSPKTHNSSKIRAKTEKKSKRRRVYRHDKNLIKSIFSTPKHKDIHKKNKEFDIVKRNTHDTRRKKKVNIRIPTSKKTKASSNGPIKLFHNYQQNQKNKSILHKKKYYRLYHSSEGPSESTTSPTPKVSSVNSTPRVPLKVFTTQPKLLKADSVELITPNDTPKMNKNNGNNNNKSNIPQLYNNLFETKLLNSQLESLRILESSNNNISLSHRKRETIPNWEELENPLLLKNKIKLSKLDLKNGSNKLNLLTKEHLSEYKNKKTYHKSLKKPKQSRNNTQRTLKNTTSLGGYISNTVRKTKKKERYNIEKQNININNKNNKNNELDKNRNEFKLLTLKDIKIKSLLGEGAFAKVYLVNLKKTKNIINNININYNNIKKKHYAMKIINRKNNNSIRNKHTNKDIKTLIWERHVLKDLTNCNFIVDYYGSFFDKRKNKYCILLDFIIGGELLFHFENQKYGRFQLGEVKFYIGEIICALEYLHNKNYIYRDLKPENILLNKDGHIKLVDFGFCKQLPTIADKTYTLCGSREYVAPEVLSGGGHGFSVDYWSLGVLTYELITGHLPFPTQDCNPYEVLDIITQTKIIYPNFLNNDIKHFIQRLLCINPNDRIGCNNYGDIQNKFLCGYGWKLVKNHKLFNYFNWQECDKQLLIPPIKPNIKNNTDVSNYATAKFDYEKQNVEPQVSLKYF